MDYLRIMNQVKMDAGTMLLALGGWMDGGLVSTGTVRALMEGRTLIKVGTIEPDSFYIYNFPGGMEVAALFRPEVTYEGGIIRKFDMPEDTFHADVEAKLVFFVGKEPNLKWQAFADCIFAVAKETGVKRILFVGSFGGSVPHTREPRLYGSVSHENLKPILEENGMRASDYEGPASFATLLLYQCGLHDIEMISLAAEIPGYLEGVNPMSIEAVARRLGRMLKVPLDMDPFRKMSNEWEAQVTELVAKDKKLAGTVRELEEQYDNELIK